LVASGQRDATKVPSTRRAPGLRWARKENTMRRFTMLSLTLALALAGPVLAQKPSAYPSKGQSASQQGKDDADCQAWAQQNTGVNPAQASQAANAPPPPRSGGVARGAVAGAAVGAIADGDTGKAAAAGAVVGGARQHRQRKEAQAAQQSGGASAMSAYWNAYANCMGNKGYSIK
jgi:hypothetical protein